MQKKRKNIYLIWNQPRCLKQRRFCAGRKPGSLWSCMAGSAFTWDSRFWRGCPFSVDVLAARAYGIAVPFLWLKLGSTSRIDEFASHCSSLWDFEGLLVIAWIILIKCEQTWINSYMWYIKSTMFTCHFSEIIIINFYPIYILLTVVI